MRPIWETTKNKAIFKKPNLENLNCHNILQKNTVFALYLRFISAKWKIADINSNIAHLKPFISLLSHTNILVLWHSLCKWMFMYWFKCCRSFIYNIFCQVKKYMNCDGACKVFYQKTLKGVIRRNNEHFLKKRKYEKLRFSEMNLLNNFFFPFPTVFLFNFVKIWNPLFAFYFLVEKSMT